MHVNIVNIIMYFGHGPVVSLMYPASAVRLKAKGSLVTQKMRYEECTERCDKTRFMEHPVPVNGSLTF